MSLYRIGNQKSREIVARIRGPVGTRAAFERGSASRPSQAGGLDDSMSSEVIGCHFIAGPYPNQGWLLMGGRSDS